MPALTHQALRAPSPLSRNAGEGFAPTLGSPLSRTAGEGGAHRDREGPIATAMGG
jgi:hypothetical protein